MPSFRTPKLREPLNLAGSWIPATDLSHTNLERANLSGANCRGVRFVGANMKDTNLTGTDLRGADLTDVRNLTVEQVRAAIIDSTTVLPSYLQLVA